MKTCFSQLLKFVTLSMVTALLLISCASTKGGNSDNPFTNFLKEASDYIRDGNKSKAKVVLLEALKMDHSNIPRSPYIKDSTLVIYTNSVTQNVVVLMFSSTFKQMKDSIGVIDSPFF